MRSGPLCSLLWRIWTWCTRKQITLKAPHIPGWLNVVADRLSRLGQTIQMEWSLLPEVIKTVCSRWHRPQIDLFHHEVQQQVASVCVTGSPDFSNGCTQPIMGGSGRLCLSTSSHLVQSGGEVAGLPMQENHSHCSGGGPTCLGFGIWWPNPTESAQSAQPIDTALQSDPSQNSNKPKSPCMAPRASAIKEQGFSEAVAARIEAPQRRLTRSVYEAKWTIFTKWCIANHVDFRAPPVKSVADFLLYRFQDRKLQY